MFALRSTLHRYQLDELEQTVQRLHAEIQHVRAELDAERARSIELTDRLVASLTHAARTAAPAPAAAPTWAQGDELGLAVELEAAIDERAARGTQLWRELERYATAQLARRVPQAAVVSSILEGETDHDAETSPLDDLT
jgi:hypothetical protein